MARTNAHWRGASLLAFAVTALFALAQRAQAQAPLLIYTDSVLNGFDSSYSWATINVANTSPVYSGTDSIRVYAADWDALWLYHANFSTATYTNLSFWINGGSGGGQIVQVSGVQVQSGNGVALGTNTLPALAKNTLILPSRSIR